MSPNARDLMIPAGDITSLGTTRTLGEARDASAGKAVTLVLDKGDNLLGVAGRRAFGMVRGADPRLGDLVDLLAPIAVTTEEARVEEMFLALREHPDLWHAVVGGGVLMGMVPPARVVMMGGEVFGPIDQIPELCLCCQATPPHCYTPVRAKKLGIGPKSPCPDGDGTTLVLRNPCPHP